MSRASFLPALFLTSVSAVALAAVVLITPDSVQAASQAASPQTKSRTIAGTEIRDIPGIQVLERSSIIPRYPLTSRHEIAAMAAIQSGLSSVPDGATFVWHHLSGRVSAIVKPTATFRDAKGRVCRHLRLLLNSGHYSRSTEGVACRLTNRIWSLEG